MPENPDKTDWAKHHEQTKEYPPSALLVKALPYVEHKGKAIDIGAGGLKDTRFLLAEGFDVTALDSTASMEFLAEELKSDRLNVAISSFADFDFPPNTYVLASSMFALPFNSPASFNQVFAKIKASLMPGGIFCGQFFGVHDDWSSDSHKTFHTKEQAEQLLADMEVLSLDEREWDGKLTNGTPKHWHVFNIIARKK